MRIGIVCGTLILLVSLAGSYRAAGAEDNPQKPGAKTTGYALKKPVFGGACNTCPWGAMAEIVKKAMQFYGYDVQICYVCAGGPREARLVAGAKMAGAVRPSPNDPPLPNGPVDLAPRGRNSCGGPIRELTISPRIRKGRGSNCGWSPTSRSPLICWPR